MALTQMSVLERGASNNATKLALSVLASTDSLGDLVRDCVLVAPAQALTARVALHALSFIHEAVNSTLLQHRHFLQSLVEEIMPDLRGHVEGINHILCTERVHAEDLATFKFRCSELKVDLSHAAEREWGIFAKQNCIKDLVLMIITDTVRRSLLLGKDRPFCLDVTFDKVDGFRLDDFGISKLVEEGLWNVNGEAVEAEDLLPMVNR